MNNTQLIQSGGVQTTVILPQIIYLDFDGELTRYNGELLTIDDVTVEDSGLTEERIAQITQALNDRFAGQNVLFVSDRFDLSDQSDYSTIYIGKTSSFAPYGSFAGLAETVDSGNRIHNDNAFVMLDSLSSNDRIADVIAHEAGHLLGTLDHGGEDLTKYGLQYIVSSGMTSTGLCLRNDSMYVRGSADSTVISAGGQMYVLNGGRVTCTRINTGGSLWLSSGALADSTEINSGGRMHMFSRGIADSTVINSGGRMNICSGGTATNTIVNSCGYLYISSGGRAFISYNPWQGGVYSSAGATVVYLERDASVYCGSGGKLVRKEECFSEQNINSGLSVILYSGGIAANTTIKSGGCLHVSSGGTATNTTVDSCGYLYVSSGGTVRSNIAGVLYLYCGAFYYGHLPSATIVSAYSGATIDFTVAEQTCPDTALISNWSAIVGGDNAFYTITVKDDQEYGTYILADYASDFSSSITIKNTSGTTCGSIPTGSLLEYDSCAFFLRKKDSYLLLDVVKAVPYGVQLYDSHFSLVSHATIMTEKTVNSGGSMRVSSGGMADRTSVDYMGELLVFSGGTVTNTVNYGSMVVFSGGMADGIIHNANLLNVFGSGIANDTTIRSGGSMNVNSGGMISGSLQIASGATVSVYQGAMIDFTVAEQTSLSEALINEWKLISGRNDAIYTLTVKAEQAGGTYRLADGASGFAKTITVKTTDGVQQGTLAVGDTLTLEDRSYTLNLQDGSLSLLVTTSIEPITITADSASKTYDGTALNASGYTYTGTLAEGDELVVTVSGSQTNAGIGVSTVSDYKVMRGELDVTASYTFNDSVDGTLTVTKRNVTLTSGDAEKVYDGTPLTCHEVNVSGDDFVSGEGAEYTFTGSQTEVGTGKNTFSYTLQDNTKAENYDIRTVEGDLTVTKPVAAKSDVDGNGVSDVMFQYTGGDYQIGFWMNGTNTWQGQGIAQDADFKLIGAYDMDASGTADALMIGSIAIFGRSLIYIGYYPDGGTQWKSLGVLDNSGNVKWKNAVGNLTGNENCNSIVWQAPELGALGVWTDGTSNWITLGSGYDSNWTMLGCGDFDGNGKDEVLFTNAGNLYTIDIDQNFTSLGGWGTDWEVKIIGDFAGDGQDDIILQNGNMLVKFNNGKADDWASIGAMDASDWFIVGAGDYNGDQQDDLLVRQYSTGMLGYYSAGDMSQWNELGRGVDMNWSVIA